MLKRITIRNLKRLRSAVIPLQDSVVFAGPNNFGKTTALQALSIWNLACKRWIEARGGAKSKAKERTGVPITRRDFTALPVRALDLLWSGRSVGKKKDEPRPPLIEIIVDGVTADVEWSWGMELQYALPEMLYCRPIVTEKPIPEEVRSLTVAHVPPLGGIQTEEEKRELGIQDRIIGEGRPGEILRNLLLQIAEMTSGSAWEDLAREIQDMFQVTLLRPSFAGTFITCEYVPPSSSEGRKPKPLDISNAGSGFHQVLLLLAFFYARPGSVLLLDEPDAHLHVILQRDVYALLKRVAADRKSQLLISTHSEVILDETDPSGIIAFTGREPHVLLNTSQRSQLKRALTRLTSLDFLLADQVGAVLYVEGDTDASILREWARILGHPAYRFLSKPFIHELGGNDLGGAKEHFFALREAYPQLKAVGVLDRSEKPQNLDDQGLRLRYWKRREVENYLLVPAALRRYVEQHAPLASLAAGVVDRAFAEQLPPSFDPFNDEVVFLRDVKASDDFLLPLLGRCGLSTSKKDLFLVATSMTAKEIHPEVRAVLDLVATLNSPEADAVEPAGDVVGGNAEEEPA